MHVEQENISDLPLSASLSKISLNSILKTCLPWTKFQG